MWHGLLPRPSCRGGARAAANWPAHHLRVRCRGGPTPPRAPPMEGAAARRDHGHASPRGERAAGGGAVRYVENRPRFIRDLLSGHEEGARAAMEAREARGPPSAFDEDPMMVDSEGNVILPSDLSRDDDLASDLGDEPSHGSDRLYSEPLPSSDCCDGLEEQAGRAAAAEAAGEARAKRARTASKLNKVHTSTCRLSFDRESDDDNC